MHLKPLLAAAHCLMLQLSPVPQGSDMLESNLAGRDGAPMSDLNLHPRVWKQLAVEGRRKTACPNTEDLRREA